MQTLEGHLLGAADIRIAIVVSRFNEVVGKGLLDGAVDALVRHGIPDGNLTVVKVPGAYEIPLAAQELAKTGRYQGIVCLGAVIRGSTAHFDYVAGPMASGIANVSLATSVPIAFGVLTTDTLEQAVDRAGAKSGNKGSDAALSTLEMIDLLRKIK
ncbi:MAG: 6,7-dimethyl-8-ribityllumazine synthase [Capsulimonadaceae bacterium]|nr:6,7-dimethyl-8-ribityllumazine synthase [Capsulimonadaceae bacterium]